MIGVALVGYGGAGAGLHAPLIEAEPGLELRAVVTRDPERRAHVQARHPTAKAVDTAEQAIVAAELVVVASPNRSHEPIARAALEAGRDVVVDKPLALTSAAAGELAALARQTGRRLVPFHNRRWDGDFLTLRRLVADGALGDVWRLESRFERWRPEPKTGWREDDPAEGGGALNDLGSHLVDQALVLLGAPTHVYAELSRRRAGAQVDDEAFLALTHAGGARSHVSVGAAEAAPGPRFRVLGSRAAYVKHDLDGQEAALRERRLGPEREAEREHAELRRGDEAEEIAVLPGDYPAFYAALAAGEEPVPAQDAVTGLRVLEAARESARRGAVVALSRRAARAPR